MGAGFTKSLVEAGVLRLIDSERALKLIGAKAKVTKGFYSKGVSYIIADNLPVSLDPYGLVMHEIGVHALNLGKNSKEFKSILDDLSKQIGVNKEITDAYRRVPRDTKPEKVMEEVCAYLIEHHPALPLARRVLAWFRAQLKRLTNNVNFMAGINRLTPDDLAYMAHTALRSAANPAIDTVPSAMPVYSRSDATKVAYEKRIDALFNGAKPKQESNVIALDSTDMLGLLGYGNDKLHIVEKNVIESAKTHNLTPEHWKKIPEWLDNPVAVFKSASVTGRLVFVAPETFNNVPILMVIEPDVQRGNKKINLLINGYDKDKGINQLNDWTKKDKLLYINNQKSQVFNHTSKLQLLARSELNKPSSDNRVRTEKDLVKYLRSQNEPLYSFAGERAQNADVAKLDTAKSMLNSGTNPEIVRQLTGWHKGADGKFKFEISDHDAALHSGANDDNGWLTLAESREQGEPLGNILNHPALFKAYPNLWSLKVKIDANEKAGGSFDSANNVIRIGDPYNYKNTYESFKSVLLHEVQHAIQSQEGFARGGSQSEFEVTPHKREEINALAWREEVEKLADDQGINLYEHEPQTAEFQNLYNQVSDDLVQDYIDNDIGELLDGHSTRKNHIDQC